MSTPGHSAFYLQPNSAEESGWKDVHLFNEVSPDKAFEFACKGEFIEKGEDEQMQNFTTFRRELSKTWSKSRNSAMFNYNNCYLILVRANGSAYAELRWDYDYLAAVSEHAIGRIPCSDIKYASTAILRDDDAYLNVFDARSNHKSPCIREFRVVSFGRTLQFRAPNRDSMKNWVIALNEGARQRVKSQWCLHNMLNLFTQVQEQISIEKISEIFSERLNYPVGREVVERMLAKIEGGATANTLSIHEVADIIRLFAIKRSLSPWFQKFAMHSEGLNPVTHLMSQQNFEDFLQAEQYDQGAFGLSNINSLFEHLDEPLVENIKGAKFLTEAGFSHMMCCSDNHLLDPVQRARVNHDMTRPLSHYFISSSHNTYLEGHQFIGESNLNRYIDVLMSGCRCVEIDCWDGDAGDPIVTHGWTMTTNLSFRDVVQTCRDYGFIVTPYPLILSLELHLSPEQHLRMGEILRETFGDMLLQQSDWKDFEAAGLPSPLEAKNRIIVKAKLAPRKGSIVRQTLRRSRSNLSNSISSTKSDVAAASACPKFFGCCGPKPKGGRTQSSREKEVDASDSGAQASPAGQPLIPERIRRQKSEESISSEVSLPSSKSERSDLSSPASFLKRQQFEFRSERSYTSELSDMSARSEYSDRTEDDTTSYTQSKANTASTDSLATTTIFMPTTKFPKKSQHPPTHQLHTCSCSSFNERSASKAMKIMGVEKLQSHHAKRISRVYPAAHRTNSANFDPIPMWLAGFHMVALNYQTVDRHMIVNEGLFANENGGCGYILKPKRVLNIEEEFTFDHSSSTLGGLKPYILDLRILSAHWLPKPREALNPNAINASVVVAVCGSTGDTLTFQTCCVQQNGFDPCWNEKFAFELEQPDVAFLVFEVVHITSSGDQQLMAAAALPLSGIREGIRWVPLHDRRLQSTEFCGLLVEARLRGPWSELRRTHLLHQRQPAVATGQGTDVDHAGVHDTIIQERPLVKPRKFSGGLRATHS